MTKDSTDNRFETACKTSTLAFLLAAFSIVCALYIGFVTFQSSLSETEREYHGFYLKEAQMLAKAAEIQKDASDVHILSSIRRIWEASEGRPSDEYICVSRILFR